MLLNMLHIDTAQHVGKRERIRGLIYIIIMIGMNIVNMKNTLKELIEIHCKEGKKRFKKDWDNANIGWCQCNKEISSKIYVFPIIIFTTSLRRGKIKHIEEKLNYR